MYLEVDGKQAFAATGGKDFDPTLPGVVFIHGAGMDRTIWQLQTRYFSHHGYAVLAPDLPGHGRSEGPALETVEEMADWIGRLLEAAGLKDAALVGHSMGALIALEGASRMPDRVRALALLGVIERMGVHPELQSAADAKDELAFDLLTSWALGHDAHLGGHKAPGLWMTGGSKRLLQWETPGALGNDLAACGAYEGAMAAAGKVACPTLFVFGVADRMTPAKAAQPLMDAIADVRAETLPCGHMMMIERPDQTLDALKQTL